MAQLRKILLVDDDDDLREALSETGAVFSTKGGVAFRVEEQG